MPGPNLKSSEHYWINLYHFLERRGYRLRPRYDPDYVPVYPHGKSWLRRNFYERPEDEIRSRLYANLLDAVRLSDGARVALRKTETWRDEVAIYHYLASCEPDERNHVVPILNMILLRDSDDCVFLVMPILRDYYDPPFSRPIQAADAVQQFLEILEFLHERNIAHRDFCTYNLMMDSSELLSGGFHFSAPSCTPDGSFGLIFRDRADVNPVKYFVIDLGLATLLPSRDSKVTGIYGQDRTVPEHTWDSLYDPFKVDIYQLGRVILMDMVNVYDDLEFLRPLATAMSAEDPSQRPDASKALAALKEATSELPATSLEKPIHVVDLQFGYLLTRPPIPKGYCC
ncbi:kinase-like domain-containing protein [Schizophyllum fasciatum]